VVLFFVSLSHFPSVFTVGGNFCVLVFFSCSNPSSIQRLVTSIKCKFGYRANADTDDEATVDGENINFESLRTVKVDELWILKQVSGEFYYFPII
jgi:hypothetical protein